MVVISHNDEQQGNNSATDPATFEDFEEHFSANQASTNVELYSVFPAVNKSTLRSWKKKVSDKMSEGQTQTTGAPTAQQDDDFYKPQLETLKNLLKGRYNSVMLKDLPTQSQLQVLTNLANQVSSSPDPNISMLPNPAGSGVKVRGIEPYINIDEKAFKQNGVGNINVRIPASKFADPNWVKNLNKKK